MIRQQVIENEEILNEPDTLEGFSSPRTIKNIYGHESAEKEFVNTYQLNRLHHAWLITGPKGIGKATLAYRFTRFLLAIDKEKDTLITTLNIQEESPTSRLVSNLSHPELLVLRRPYDLKTNKLRTEITVDEVRRLKSFLSLRSGISSSKIVIVDPADELNLNAANAILKSIEEPSSQTYFFLITSNPDNLLPTIRSRCRVLRCKSLSNDNLQKALIQALKLSDSEVSLNLPTGDDWEKLKLVSDGSVGFALRFLSLKGLNIYSKLISIIFQMPQCNWRDIHVLCDELTSQASELKFELFYELLLSSLARLIYEQAYNNSSNQEGQITHRVIQKEHLSSWAELWETIVIQKSELDLYNLDKKSFLFSVFRKISQLSITKSI